MKSFMTSRSWILNPGVLLGTIISATLLLTASADLTNCAPPPSGLVSWWRAEGSASDSADSNHGTLLNGASLASGMVGQAFGFNGSNQCVQIPYVPSLANSNYAVEAWVKPLAQVSDFINQDLIFGQSYGQCLLLARTGTTGVRIAFQFGVSHFTFYEVVSATEIPIGQFSHLVGTWDGTTLRLYVNGLLNAQMAPGAVPVDSGCPFQIGGFYSPEAGGCNYVGQFFNGLIDEVSYFNRALSGAEIQSIYNAGSAGKCAPAVPPSTNCVPAPAGLVSWWRAEGNASDSADSNPGVLLNGASFASGMVGQAFALDGVNDAVIVSNAPGLNFGAGQDFSIEAWIEPLSSTTYYGVMSIVDKRLSPSWTQDVGYEFNLEDGRLHFRMSDSLSGPSYSFGPAGSDMRDGQFHHVAVTLTRNSATGGKLYVDGQVVLTFDPTVAPGDLSSTEPFRIGVNANSTFFSNFRGAIDEVSLYSRALSGAEIQSVYNAGSAGKCAPAVPPSTNCVPAPAGLVSWWPAESNANDAADSNNGVLRGGISFTTGRVGQALSFNGTDADVRVPASPNLNVGAGAGLTIETWINPADVTQQRPLVEWNSGSFGAQLWLSTVPAGGGAGPGCLTVNLKDIGFTDHSFTTPGGRIVSNAWQHVAVTYNKTNGNTALYINGAMITQTNIGVFTPMTTGDLYFGLRPFDAGAGLRYAGQMDEISLYHRALAATEIQAIYQAGSAGKCGPAVPPLTNCVPAPAGLVSWWRAETNALDEVGGNNGSLHNGVGFASGLVGQALSFDGINSYVEVPDSPSLRLTNALTIEFWVKRKQLDRPYGEVIIEKGGDWTGGVMNYGVVLAPAPYGYRFAFWCAGVNRQTAGIADTNWHHYAVVARHGDVDPTCYIDGVQRPVIYREGGTTLNLYPSTRPLHIGAQVDPISGWDYYSKTLIDELSIYNRVLTGAEIQAIYSAGSLGKCSPGVAPSITAQPASQTVLAGASATFTASAVGTPPLSYRWRFNGTNVAGATGASLSLSNVQPAQAGSYVVVVTNAFGSATSSHAVLTVIPPAPCAAPPAGLVGWWPGAGNANDAVGGNNGTLQGGVTFSPGVVGQAYNFNPANGTVVVPDSSSLRLTNQLTIEAWINARSVSGNPGIISKVGIATGNHGYQLGLWDHRLVGLLNGPDQAWPSGAVASGPLITTGQWYHVVFTYDQSAMKLYVNGMPVATNVIGPQVIAATTTDLRISGADDHCFFDGLIDEPSVYNRALSVTEIAAIYNAGSAGKCPPGVAPSIITQPASQTVLAGSPVTFTVIAAGTPPLSYQWRKGGVARPGSTNPMLQLPNATTNDAGTYDVVITNSFGAVTSQVATLTVRVPTSQMLLNVNFAAYTQVKLGFAATGQTPSDFWNNYTAPFQAFAWLSNLAMADGTPTTVGLTVQNGAGHWGFTHPDLMYNCFCYSQDNGDIILTVTNLPSGGYDFYLYGHSGAANGNTVFQLLVDGANYGNLPTGTHADSLSTNWVEGAQYVVYRNVAVTNGGAPVTIKAHPGLSGYALLNGMQIALANRAPVALCADAVVAAGTNCQADASVNNGSFDPDGDPVTISQVPPGPYPLGTNRVTLTVVDNHGASNSCSALVIVQDRTPPVIICASNKVVECGSAWSFDPPVAFDSCSATNVLISVASTMTNAGCGGTFMATRTWQAEDGATNTATCSQTVMVLDTTPPTIVCPASITLEFQDENGAVAPYVVTASDTCSSVSLVITPASGSVLPIGVAPVQATAMDGCTNLSQCAFTVTVLGAQGVKSNVLAELIALRSSVVLTEPFAQKFDDAIQHLQDSLNPAYWIDQTHLQSKGGNMAMNEEKLAANKLAEIMDSKDCPVAPAVLQGFIDRIVKCDRLLAVLSIQEAANAGLNPRKVEQDLAMVAKGDREADAGHYANAIEHYRNAWRHAIQLRVQVGLNPDGTTRLQFVGNNSKSYLIEVSTDMVTWVPLGTCTANGDADVEFTDPAVASQSVRFYRAVEQ
jgi:hypothetical protein